MDWNDSMDAAPEGVEVWTKIHDEHGERNIQKMRKQTRIPGKTRPMWFAGEMYVYYAPTHWAAIE